MIFFLIILLLNEKTAARQECGAVVCGEGIARSKTKPIINSELTMGLVEN
jgi:hypothetical protein